MEKTLIRSRPRNTKNVRIKNIHIKLLKEVGEGNQQKGIEKIIDIYKRLKKNPEGLCMKHISDFMDDVDRFYGANHLAHMKNLPTALLMGLRRGGNCDFSIVGKRQDTSIDSFMETKEKKDVEKK